MLGLGKQYSPLLFKVAFQAKDAAPACGLEVDDYINAGYYGLYKAAITFDDTRGPFPAYAKLLVTRTVWNVVREHSTPNRKIVDFSYPLEEEIINADNLVLNDVVGETDPYISKDVLPEDAHGCFSDYFFEEFSIMEEQVIRLRLDGYQSNEIMKMLGISKYFYYEMLKNIKLRISKMGE